MARLRARLFRHLMAQGMCGWLAGRANDIGIKHHIGRLRKFASVLQNWVSSIVCEQESS